MGVFSFITGILIGASGVIVTLYAEKRFSLLLQDGRISVEKALITRI